MPRISLFGSFIRIKYKLELDHVIRVAVNKHVFVESKFTYLRVTLTCSQYTVAVNSKLGRTTGKESSHLWKQLLFIQIHLWRKNLTLHKKWSRTGPGRELGCLLWCFLRSTRGKWFLFYSVRTFTLHSLLP